jgi:Ca-activated chloride channel family protein
MSTKPIRSFLCIIPSLTIIASLSLGGCAMSSEKSVAAGARADSSIEMSEDIDGEAAPMDDEVSGDQYLGGENEIDAPAAAPALAENKEEGAAERDLVSPGDAMVARPSPKADKRTRRVKQGGKARKNKQAIAMSPPPEPEFNTEAYDRIVENEFLAVADKPLSTFSIDVDTASFSNTRRFIESGELPPPDAVRIEEMINYFSYDYEGPRGKVPFSLTTEVSDCPWNDDARLVHVGIQGKKIDMRDVPPRNLVFLLDVSGSMDSPDKLPLLKRAMSMLANNLQQGDKISIVVYAGASGVVLEPTSNSSEIKQALNRLSAGGSTNGGAGIDLAYDLAQRNFVKGGINRVILATDGDFNVGSTSRGELERLIEDQRKGGVFLSVLGFGTGNVKDSTMEMLADKGNGNYAYIDSAREARKVLVEEASSTLVTIAKDVKIQVEFNPSVVSSYRLVGYENRALADRDFNDDTKDAGEIGAGHTVTALYEVIPAQRGTDSKVDPLRYQEGRSPSTASSSGELMFLKLRYKQPDGNKSQLLSFPVQDHGLELGDSSDDFRFAAAVAEYGMILRNSKFKGDATLDHAHKMAKRAIGSDAGGHKREFVKLIRKAERLGADKSPLAIAR